MSRRGDPRRTRRYRRLRAETLAWWWAIGAPCHICGHPAPDSPDHLIPVSWQVPGIDPLDATLWRPSHHRPCPTCGRRCQRERGANPMAPGLDTSREW
jgi:hypothetical protein